MSNEADKQEVIKKPSAGLSYSRKLNTGGDYENEELELWGTTGSLDSLDYEDFRDNLSALVDEVAEEMEERVKEIRARDGELPKELRDKLEDVARVVKSGDQDRALEMLNKITRSDSSEQ